MTIALTGGNGKLGRAVTTHLREHGHTVIVLDLHGERGSGFVRVDLSDYGQTIDALFGVNDQHDGLDSIVHLGAIPAPGLAPDSEIFHNNMAATFNVFHGARRAGIQRIVYASSETVLGLPFDAPPPYIPVDEQYDTRPESVYSLVKHLEEEMAQKLVRWDPELSITALRFSNVMDPDDYADFAGWDSSVDNRKWNLWGYIDARDGAQAVRRALEVAQPGFEAFIIAAADTVSARTNASLVSEVFPDVAYTPTAGEHDTLLSINKARRVLGFAPEFSWRD
ncbi:MAG: NAD-dependent epimerase/dehydratase family protein [Microbacteriaceae bacterium]